MKFRVFLKGSFILFFLFLITAPVHAHRVILFAWSEGNTVHTVSKFPGGGKAVDTPVAVYDDQGIRILDGKTDKKGEFSFSVDEPATLKIVLEAGLGHQAEWTLSKDDFESAGENTMDSGTPETKNAVSDNESGSNSEGHSHSPTTSGMSPEQIEEMVSRAVKKQMEPMMRIISDMQDTGPRMSEIFGGLGYILGLFGIAAYVTSRKK